MILRSRNPLIVEVLRGPLVESAHEVMAVVADDRGSVMGFHGNHDFVTYPRSSIKMLQAIPLVESGALRRFGLDDRDLALACSSHAGEKQHLLVVSRWMDRLGIQEDLLQCGPAWPADEPTKFEMIRKGLTPRRMIHNCSGKHLGLLSAATAWGMNPLGYHDWSHPLQERLRQVLSEMMGVDHSKLPWGVDGCGIPTYGVPLQALAVGFGKMLSTSHGEARALACQQILSAMRAHPQMVGGSREFVSVLMERTSGRILAKAGAEGVYSAFIPHKRLAVVLKCHDGAKRATEVALGGLLRYLGALNDEEFVSLREYTMPSVKNSRGEEVGEIRLQKGSLS